MSEHLLQYVHDDRKGDRTTERDGWTDPGGSTVCEGRTYGEAIGDGDIVRGGVSIRRNTRRDEE